MLSTAGSYPLEEDEILWDAVAEHLDEAEFMFDIWEAALDAPNYTLAEVAAGPERRLLAHVDALLVGGPLVAERILLPTIEDSDSYYERVTAASLALCSSGESARVVEALVEMETSEDDQRSGLVRALELSDDRDLDARLNRALDSAGGSGCAALLEALARRRAPVGDWVGRYLRSDDRDIARAAAWLARRCSDPRVLDGLTPLAQSDDAELRRVAVETALIRRVAGAWESAAYWAFSSGDSPFRRDALTWVATLGDAAAQQRVLELVDSAEHREDALWALGFGGRAMAVDRCVELLGDDDLAALAAEVICGIAGLPTDEDRFWRAPPRIDGEEHALPRLQDDDLDRDLVPTAEAALPIPEPEEIARWWHERRAEFDPALRYLGGQVLTDRVLVDALQRAPMRRRHNLALELGLRTSGEVTVSTRALSGQQQTQLTWLAQLAELDTIDFQRGLRLR